MNIPDSILKYQLRNVYFLCGTACGGKTTISKELAKKHGFLLFDEEMGFSAKKRIHDLANQSAVIEQAPDWEHYFMRPYKEYHESLDESIKEQIPITLMELIKMPAEQKVIVDMHMPIQTAMTVTDCSRIAFLVADPDMVIKDYYLRPDHMGIYKCIMSLKEPKKALENVNKMLAYGTQLFLDELYTSDVFYIKREPNSTVINTLAQVEKHFGL